MQVETIGDATLWCGDNIEIMASMKGLDAHAMITDPPYCSGAATEAGKGSATHQGLRSETIRSGRFEWFSADNMTTSGLCELLRLMCVRASDLLCPTGSILSFCDWRMVTSLAPSMESAGWRQRNLIIWDKGNFGCGTGFRPRHEMIIHLTKRAPKFYSASFGNVLNYSRPGDREHPTQKPVELISDMIEVVSPAGGTIIDPFMGSGTAGVACAKMGRKFVGIEIDPKHFDTACRRVEAEQSRPGLFVKPRTDKLEQAELL